MIARWPSADIGPIGELIARVIELYPGDKQQLYITSGRDSLDEHGYGSHHNENRNRWNNSPTAAIDIGFNNVEPVGRAFAGWLQGSFTSDMVELIFTGVVSHYVKNGNAIAGYGPLTNEAHRNHVHLAMSAATAQHVLNRFPPPLADPPPDFTPEQAVHFEVACWRVAAMLSASPTVTGGPLAGEANKFS